MRELLIATYVLLLILIEIGSILLLTASKRAWRVWGLGRIGKDLTVGTVLMAVSWALVILGWVLILYARLPAIPFGTAVILSGQITKLVSLFFMIRGFRRLEELGDRFATQSDQSGGQEQGYE